jgi:peptidoglycan LD-endopeptidase LytH
MAVAALVAALVAVLAGPAGPAASASAEDDLRAARQRANQVAADLSAAEEALARSEDTVAHLQQRLARTEARAAQAHGRVRELAVRLYVEGTSGVTRLLRMGEANELVLAQGYSDVIAGASTDALRQFRADRAVMVEEQAVLAREMGHQEAAAEQLRRQNQAAIAEIDRLAEVAARAQAAREAEARQAAARQAAASPTGGAGPAAGAGAAPAGTAAPSPVAAASPAVAAVPAGGGWVCPVQGPLAFSNDYGAPRGGGYSHMGNDILAPRGTPVVAHVGGVVTHRDGAVSGLAYFLAGDDGNRYFGAHLDSFGASGRVSAGTVIGTVGNTGDAAGGPPHLHFEMHPGGTGNVNPYPMLVQYC